MRKATEIIRRVASETERAILFHSASGKDSIALLELMSPHFREIVCAFMYTVPGLEHITRYIEWAQRRYANARFVQMPHYGVYSYIREGYLGCKRNPNQKVYNLGQLTDITRERTSIDWVFYGFKKSDSLNRRLMLQTYTMEAINEQTKKVYPLSTYKNGDVLRFIDERGLIKPESYGGKAQSSGCDVNDLDYLLYLRNEWPNDLRKVLNTYPLAERKLFDYDNGKEN